MERAPFKSRELVDYIFSAPKGVNAGVDPITLPKDQLSNGVNITVRGDFIRPRPKFRKIDLSFIGYDGNEVQSNMEGGKFQGACVYNPDIGLDSLMASISGRLFRFWVSGDMAIVTDESIPGHLDDPTQNIAWLIQAEQWVIRTDGVAYPLFYTGTPEGSDPNTVRSTGTGSITYTSTTQTDFSVPNIGAQVYEADGVTPKNITLFSPFTGNVGDVITFSPVGGFLVTAISGADVQLKNFNATPIGASIKNGYTVTWTALGNQLPVGRQMAYGLGRVWMALPDGKQFVAGDLVGGAAGTLAYNFRDSVLNMTENTYLLGGGRFTVPGSYGEIQALCFSETLDSSLGQGALLVFTRNVVFSCNAPVDRLTWQSLKNPILTECSKGGGALSQWATTNVNSDIISRSKDGLRSLSLSRRDFNTWGNTPISREVQPQLDRDSVDLLRYCSGCVFDNRRLTTTEPELTDRGTIWKRIIPINMDQNSNLQGKAPSVYDSLYWSGLNVFQILAGDFGHQERCFAFTLNKRNGKIELWEVLPSADPEIYDNGDTRVVWGFEAMLDFGQKDPRNRERLRLGQAELYVDALKGLVDFNIYYKPDSWPCWIPWASWQECSESTATVGAPSFRPFMGVPEPDPGPCDPENDRPLREGGVFMVRLVVAGQCTFKGMRVGANTVPQPHWMPPVCDPICPGDRIIAADLSPTIRGPGSPGSGSSEPPPNPEDEGTAVLIGGESGIEVIGGEGGEELGGE